MIQYEATDEFGTIRRVNDTIRKLQMKLVRFESSFDDHDNHFGDLKSK